MATGWGETGDAAALLEAFHRLDLDEQPWLDGVARAFEQLTPGGLALGLVWSLEPGRSGFRPVAFAGAPGFADRVAGTAHQADDEFLAATMASDRRVFVLSDLFGDRLATLPISTIVLDGIAATDVLGLQAAVHGPTSWGVTLAAGRPGRVELSAAGLATWHRVAAHLAAAARLRLEGLDAHPVEGILRSDGRVEHAEGVARGQESREALTRAVRAIERARRRDARTDPHAVLDAWRAIVERRWSLVDVVESDGRRTMVARVNPAPAVADHRFTPREKQVAALLAQGVPQKAIGYELTMSPSTVAFHVKNVARKLGETTRTGVVRALATRGGGSWAPPTAPPRRARQVR